MDATSGDDNLGLLGRYGVLVVPAPSGEDGAWLLTLGRWDSHTECYVARTDGPMFDSAEEAFEQARYVANWITENGGQGDLERGWEVINQAFSEHSNPWTGTSLRDLGGIG